MTDRFRAVFFDLDGTLADSLPALREVFGVFLDRHGIPRSAEDFETYNGPALPEIIRRLRSRHRLAASESQLVREYAGLVTRAYREGVRLMDGAAQVLQRLKDDGYLVGLVTSVDRETAFAFLTSQDLHGLVDRGVFGNEVKRSKPDPEGYRLAASRAGVAPGSSVAVEDSVNGVLAAASAGLRVVGLAPHGPDAALTRAGASLVVEDLSRVVVAIHDLEDR